MESSKATAKYIKQMQVNHKQLQFISCDTNAQSCHPASSKENKRNSLNEGKLQTSTTRKINKEKECHKCIEEIIMITKLTQVKKNIPVKTDVINVVTSHMWRDLDVQSVDINARIATSLVILVACAIRKKSLITRESQENPGNIN